MVNYEERLKKILDVDEKVIFIGEADLSISLLTTDIDNEPLIKLNVYITNLANLYFVNEDNNEVYYFKQGKITKRISYKVQENIVVCKIDRFMIKPEEKRVLFNMAYVNGEIKIENNKFESILTNLNRSFFDSEDEEKKYEEEIAKDNEDDLLVGSNLIKIYGDNRSEIKALNHVTVRIKEKDFICIMGPSGSGKSTLINILSTIDAPTNGKVVFQGKNLLAMNESEISKFRYENLGFIFQDFNLVDNLTIKENIAVPLILSSIGDEEIEKRIKEIAKKLDIEKILDKYPAQCSGGQKQRAACSRALVTKPKIIVADEPTGSLDTKNSHELLRMMQELNEKEGITVVMVTHDNMIASYSKKLIFIRDGIVDQVIERQGRTQKEYFYNIVEITSKESQNLIDIL